MNDFDEFMYNGPLKFVTGLELTTELRKLELTPEQRRRMRQEDSSKIAGGQLQSFYSEEKFWDTRTFRVKELSWIKTHNIMAHFYHLGEEFMERKIGDNLVLKLNPYLKDVLETKTISKNKDMPSFSNTYEQQLEDIDNFNGGYNEFKVENIKTKKYYFIWRRRFNTSSIKEVEGGPFNNTEKEKIKNYMGEILKNFFDDSKNGLKAGYDGSYSFGFRYNELDTEYFERELRNKMDDDLIMVGTTYTRILSNEKEEFNRGQQKITATVTIQDQTQLKLPFIIDINIYKKVNKKTPIVKTPQESKSGSNLFDDPETFFKEDFFTFFEEDVPTIFEEDVPTFFEEDVPAHFKSLSEVDLTDALPPVFSANKGIERSKKEKAKREKEEQAYKEKYCWEWNGKIR